tara:strand:- start:226 stop:969 length:744 start_codon:yes stop_codon:yes gene_type:complete
MQTIDNNFTTTEDDKYLTYQYLKKHEDLVIHITPKIKNSNVLNVLSFCGTEYDQFFSKYEWDTLKQMFRYFLIHDIDSEDELVDNFNDMFVGDTEESITTETDNHYINPVDFTEHFFKKFKRFQNVIPVFYPNAETDPEHDGIEQTSNEINFNRFHWFYCVDGDRNFPTCFDDSCTNYNGIIKMFIQILKHFDYWYWNHYDGDNVVETSLVEDIVDIFKTIEKFYYADRNKTAKEIDETFEEASLYI